MTGTGTETELLHRKVPAVPKQPPPSTRTPAGSRSFWSFFRLSRNEFEVLICALGIYVCYLYYGTLHEKLYKTSYEPDAGRWNFSFVLICLQCAMNAGSAALVLMYQKISGYEDPGSKTESETKQSCPWHQYALAATSYLLAMAFSFEALNHMTYPMQALGKSCKMIPVMLMGIVIRKKKYRLIDYAIVIMITIGVAIFSYKPSKSKDIQAHTSPLGIFLLFMSLFMDGLVGPFQEKLVATYAPSTHQLMFHQNLWASMITLVGSVATGELFQALKFLEVHPSAVIDVFMFCVVSAVGQNFIFYTVRNVSALACTTITTTRKFFTILLSIVMYNHKIHGRQWFAIILVFSGIILEHVAKKSKRKSDDGCGTGDGADGKDRAKTE